MLVFYGSKYGTAKRYAEEFARRAGTAAMSVRGRAPAAEGQTVVFFGALYAGKVRGLKKAAKRAAHCARLLVVTVGLADPSEPQVAESRRRAVLAGLPQDMHKQVQMFHLRGAIDYARLSAVHRLLMKMVRSMAERTPPEQRSPELRSILETYGKSADYTDLSALAAISDAANAESRSPQRAQTNGRE